MRIQFEKYNLGWKQSFEKLKEELTQLIGFPDREVEHIGSTSVDGLSARPIIDVLVGIKSESGLTFVFPFSFISLFGLRSSPVKNIPYYIIHETAIEKLV